MKKVLCALLSLGLLLGACSDKASTQTGKKEITEYDFSSYVAFSDSFDALVERDNVVDYQASEALDIILGERYDDFEKAEAILDADEQEKAVLALKKEIIADRSPKELIICAREIKEKQDREMEEALRSF